MVKSAVVIVLAVVVAMAGVLPTENLLGIIVLVAGCYCYRLKLIAPWQKVLLWLLMVILAFVLATWRPEGFSYPLLMEYGHGEDTFSLYANVSKGLVGLCLLLMLWPTSEPRQYRAALPWRIFVLIVSPSLIVVSAIALLQLEWQSKALEHIVIFAVANLVLTCVAEEAFLRLLLQQSLIQILQRWTHSALLQECIPLLLVTGIFVALHPGLEGAAISVYALAGLLYGLAYTVSKNVLYPIVVHAAVNIAHFSLLTYPL